MPHSIQIAKGFIVCFDEYAAKGTIGGEQVPNFPNCVAKAKEYVQIHRDIDPNTIEALEASILKAQSKFDAVVNSQIAAGNLTQDSLPAFPQDRWVEIVRVSPFLHLHPLRLVIGGVQSVFGNYVASYISREWIPYNPITMVQNTASYMTLGWIPYNATRGEWIPYNSTRALGFFALKTIASTVWDYVYGPSFSGKLKPQNSQEEYLAPILNGLKSLSATKNEEIGVLISLKQDHHSTTFPFGLKVNQDGTVEYQKTDIEITGFDESRPIDFQLQIFKKR